MVQESRTIYGTQSGGYADRVSTRKRIALRIEAQNGHRSGPKAASVPPPPSVRDSYWGGSRRVLAGLDKIERSLTGGGGITNTVNNRDYSVTDNVLRPLHVPGSRPATSWTPATRTAWDGEIYFSGLSLPAPTLPEHADVARIAIPLMRNSRPTAPHAGLAQFVAELQDLKQLSGWNPVTNPGSAYLGAEWGVKPTMSDIRELATAVRRSKPILRDFARQAGQEVKRRRRVVYSDSVRDFTLNGSSVGSHGPTCQARGTLHTVTEIRTFATFEYFVADPVGFLGRAQSYEQKAQHLLGTRPGIDVAWELTPFSWLVDWFTDVGGLLAYQQSVMSDSLVAKWSGYVVETTSTFSGGAKINWSSNSNFVPDRDHTVFVNVRRRVQKRRAASPYTFTSPSADITPRRAAILGALGLAKAGF